MLETKAGKTIHVSQTWSQSGVLQTEVSSHTSSGESPELTPVRVGAISNTTTEPIRIREYQDIRFISSSPLSGVGNTIDNRPFLFGAVKRFSMVTDMGRTDSAFHVMSAEFSADQAD